MGEPIIGEGIAKALNAGPSVDPADAARLEQSELHRLQRENAELRKEIQRWGSLAAENGLTAADLRAKLAAAERRSGFYVASRASIPERAAMWRWIRRCGVRINSTWID